MTEHTPATGLRAAEAAAEALAGVTAGKWKVGARKECEHEAVIGGDRYMVADCNIMSLRRDFNREDSENGANARFIAYARQGVPDLVAALTASLERERLLRGLLKEVWGCSYTSTETERVMTLPLDLFNRIHLGFFPDQGIARRALGGSHE